VHFHQTSSSRSLAIIPFRGAASPLLPVYRGGDLPTVAGHDEALRGRLPLPTELERVHAQLPIDTAQLVELREHGLREARSKSVRSKTVAEL
jgi:hypothetical protein